jgi:hypothetical protein
LFIRNPNHGSVSEAMGKKESNRESSSLLESFPPHFTFSHRDAHSTTAL